MRAMFDWVRRDWLVPGCVAVLLLTVLAGVLQYRGINRWSNAVRRQRREVMERTLRNFSGDFRATLLQLLPFFRAPPDGRNDAAFEPYMIESARRWHSTSDRPQLLASISIGTQSDQGSAFRQLQTGDNQFKTEDRSEEHTSELQSHLNLVCRLLLEKKKQTLRPRSNPPLDAQTHSAHPPNPPSNPAPATSTSSSPDCSACT